MSSILISGTLEPQASLFFLLTQAPLHSTMAHMETEDQDFIVVLTLVGISLVVLLTLGFLGVGGGFSEDFWQWGF